MASSGLVYQKPRNASTSDQIKAAFVFARADCVSVQGKLGGTREHSPQIELLHLSLLIGLIFKSGILLRIPADERCLQARFEPRVRVSWAVFPW
jgi:hypothetical protein